MITDDGICTHCGGDVEIEDSDTNRFYKCDNCGGEEYFEKSTSEDHVDGNTRKNAEFTHRINTLDEKYNFPIGGFICSECGSACEEIDLAEDFERSNVPLIGKVCYGCIDVVFERLGFEDDEEQNRY